MTPDTAEMAALPSTAIERSTRPPITSRAGELDRWAASGAATRTGAPRVLARADAVARARWRAWAADEARVRAARESVRALAGSRALVWLAGSGTLALFGYSVRKAFDPPGVTRGFGWLGDLFAGPAARWDASWYLAIAHYGYRPDLGAVTAPRTAFFPVYPLALGGVSRLGLAPVLAGVLISVAALGLALYGIHRLTALEFGRRTSERSRAGEAARLAVLLTAFAPMAVFLSAVYSESLFLALSVALFWSARQGRWAIAGVAAALAGATRSAGVVLLLPAAILYLYGPREDRLPELREGAREGVGRARAALRALRPRYRLRRDAVWLALAPVGLAIYMGYLALAGGDALAPFRAQVAWGRHFAGPYAAVWDGAKAAWAGLRQLLLLHGHHVYFPAASGSPDVAAGHNLLLAGFLIAAAVALLGVLRTLPLAYGAYVIAALAMPLSYPVAAQPLMSLPRFLLVLFPLTMWLAGWLAARPRLRTPALALSALLMALFAAQFSAWHWVA